MSRRRGSRAGVAAMAEPDQSAELRVDALRGVLLGIPFDLRLDLRVLIVAAAASIVAAASLLDRLAR